MLKMLDPEFKFHVEMDDLIITQPPADGQNSVYNRKLCMLHHHDFYRVDGQVKEVTQEQVDNINKKYQFLFERFHTDISKAENPTFVMNAILNQPHVIPPEDDKIVPTATPSPNYILETLHKHFGDKCNLIIVDINDGQHVIDGKCNVIRFPDNGHRYGLPTSESYAEPVHVFEQAYDLVQLELSPSSVQLADKTSSDITISNNQPKVVGIAKA